MTSEEKRKANLERVARWRKKSGWVGKQRAREASKRWYRRKVEASGRKVRERRGRPRIDESINFKDISRTQSKEVVERPVEETYYADEEGVDIGYPEAGRRVRQAGFVRDGVEAPGIGREAREIGEDAGQSGAISQKGGSRGVGGSSDTVEDVIAKLAQLQGRQAAGKLNAITGPGVEVDIVI